MTTVTTEIRGRQVVMIYLDKDRWSVEVDGKKLGSRFQNAAACVMAAARYVASVPATASENIPPPS